MRPFAVWSVDLIPSLPTALGGYKVLAVAVDCFTKFVELGTLRNKEASTVADWFERAILARYGLP